MSSSNHTPISSGAPADAATFNAPLGQLDAAIDTTASDANAALAAAVADIDADIAAMTLDDLADAATSTPADGDLLAYDGGDARWEAKTLDEAGVGAQPVGARVYHNANTPVTSGTLTTLNFNSEWVDDANLHSVSVNPSRLTAPSDGWYSIGASIRFQSDSTGIRMVSLKHSIYSYIARERRTASGNSEVTVSTMYYMSAGQYVEVEVFQDSGGSLNAEYVARLSPEAWMVKVG